LSFTRQIKIKKEAQVTGLHTGEGFESISEILTGDRFHVTLRILSREMLFKWKKRSCEHFLILRFLLYFQFVISTLRI